MCISFVCNAPKNFTNKLHSLCEPSAAAREANYVSFVQICVGNGGIFVQICEKKSEIFVQIYVNLHERY